MSKRIEALMRVKDILINSTENHSPELIKNIENAIRKGLSFQENDNLCALYDDEYPQSMEFKVDDEIMKSVYDEDTINEINADFGFEIDLKNRNYIFIDETYKNVLKIEEVTFFNLKGELESKSNVVYFYNNYNCENKVYLQLTVDHLINFLSKNNIEISKICDNKIIKYSRMMKIKNLTLNAK